MPNSDVHFITKVGSDVLVGTPLIFINSSKSHKSVIYQTRNTNGYLGIMVNGDTGDNVIAIIYGANMTISLMKSPFRKAIVHSDIVLVQLGQNLRSAAANEFVSHKNDAWNIINQRRL
ncbi:hypothetical protein KCP69_04760 [Salmonella enterica subsp. enterica]|nr:hypothetical protein KCP69_04760 [Salmonella enterica subsp. enterica]